jgi:hypothetical protein
MDNKRRDARTVAEGYEPNPDRAANRIAQGSFGTSAESAGPEGIPPKDD